MEEDILRQLDARRYDAAFELLVQAYQDKIYRLAWTMLGDAVLAEDAAQDALLRVWRALAGFRRQSALGTWVYAITRNVCLTAARSRAVRRTVPLAGNEPVAAPRRDGLDVAALVADLPAHYQQVLQLYYMQERSYQEVADMLGLPMGTVKTYLHRARKQLAAAAVESGYAVEVR